MEKGRFGIKMAFYGVTAFILAFLGYSTALFLLAGVVIFAEKNEWASRQVIQAICLCVVNSLLNSVLGIFDFIYKIPFIGIAWGTIISVLQGIIGIVILVFVIIGIAKNAKGNEANIPLASKFADWAYGVVRPKAASQAGAQGFCASCGAPLTGGAFCNTCGKPVGAQAPNMGQPAQNQPNPPQQ